VILVEATIETKSVGTSVLPNFTNDFGFKTNEGANSVCTDRKMYVYGLWVDFIERICHELHTFTSYQG